MYKNPNVRITWYLREISTMNYIQKLSHLYFTPIHDMSNSLDCNLQGSSIRGISGKKTGVLLCPRPRDQNCVSCTAGRFFYLLSHFESPLDSKIKLVSPKGNQPWIFIGRIDAEAGTPILWPSDVKTNLLVYTLMLGKIEGRRRGSR